MISLGVIGECMLEFSQHDDIYQLGYGGDVFNTAVYATRLGLDVSFFTATGDDHYSRYLVGAWNNEGVNTNTVRIIPGGTPGLYIIQTDDTGERSFHYWRDTTPFKQWLKPGSYLDTLPEQLAQHQCVYFSGISLALLEDADRTRLLELLADYRIQGGLVAFDPNYRPRLWQNHTEATTWIDKAYGISNMAFPSYDDEALLRGETSHDKLIQNISTLGVPEIVLKNGAGEVMIFSQGDSGKVPTEPVHPVVDTTAAGDAFNGGYLSTRLKGAEAIASAKKGCRTAAQVIQHRGAIIPA